MSSSSRRKYGYITVITDSTHLPGVLVLAHSLRKETKSNYPFYILYTSSLPQQFIETLKSGSSYTNLHLCPIEPLHPPAATTAQHSSSGNSNNTQDIENEAKWTILRAFQPQEETDSAITLCYLSISCLVRKDVDRIFDLELPSPTHIAAPPICICSRSTNSSNPRAISPDINTANCIFTHQKHLNALDPASLIPAIVAADIGSEPREAPSSEGGPAKTNLLDTEGIFVFSPGGGSLWSDMEQFLQDSVASEQQIADMQAFLGAFFEGRWLALPWCFGAPEGLRAAHKEIWRDEEVVVVRYAGQGQGDLPWQKEGDGATTQQWWWDAFQDWERNCQQKNGQEAQRVFDVVDEYVAGRGKDASFSQKDQQQHIESAIRPRRLGERGHGPVVHPHGQSWMEP